MTAAATRPHGHTATCHYCDFSRSKLDGANLSRVPLTYARFDDASLRDADLSRAVMIATSLTAATLCGADLTFTNLSRSNLEGADLRGANLSFANLSGANLSDVCHDQATTWRGVRYNQRTRWFDGERRRPSLP